MIVTVLGATAAHAEIETAPPVANAAAASRTISAVRDNFIILASHGLLLCDRFLRSIAENRGL